MLAPPSARPERLHNHDHPPGQYRSPRDSASRQIRGGTTHQGGHRIGTRRNARCLHFHQCRFGRQCWGIHTTEELEFFDAREHEAQERDKQYCGACVCVHDRCSQHRSEEDALAEQQRPPDPLEDEEFFDAPLIKQRRAHRRLRTRQRRKKGKRTRRRRRLRRAGRNAFTTEESARLSHKFCQTESCNVRRTMTLYSEIAAEGAAHLAEAGEKAEDATEKLIGALGEAEDRAVSAELDCALLLREAKLTTEQLQQEVERLRKMELEMDEKVYWLEMDAALGFGLQQTLDHHLAHKRELQDEPTSTQNTNILLVKEMGEIQKKVSEEGAAGCLLEQAWDEGYDSLEGQLQGYRKQLEYTYNELNDLRDNVGEREEELQEEAVEWREDVLWLIQKLYGDPPPDNGGMFTPKWHTPRSIRVSRIEEQYEPESYHSSDYSEDSESVFDGKEKPVDW